MLPPIASSGVRYAIIMPVRNEECFIGDTVESILAQAILPKKWIIVDDGSTDGTARIVDEYARRCDFINVVHLPARAIRKAGGEDAVAHALSHVDLSHYEFLARFDADITLQSDYIGKILEEFARDPRLGIAGGGLYVQNDGGLELERVPEYHVRGALKMYRRECFEQIGGLCAGIGWDTIDEVNAWIKGWKTKSFFQYKVIHCRPTGTGIGASRLQWERGRAEYFTWSWPPFVAGKAVKIGLVNLSVVQPLCYMAGFMSCYLRSLGRIPDTEFVRARRSQQRQRFLPIMGRRRQKLDAIA